MTTYKNIDFETAETLRDAINSELSALAYPYAVKHKTYGEGQLTFVKAPLIGGSLYATIDFAAGTKTLSMDVVLASNLLEMPEILLETLIEAQTAFKTDFIEREQAQRAAERKAREDAENIFCDSVYNDTKRQVEAVFADLDRRLDSIPFIEFAYQELSKKLVEMAENISTKIKEYFLFELFFLHL